MDQTMYYQRRNSSGSSILDVFSLNPPPYPVLLVLALIFVFLGLQWYVSYESVVESTEENMGWVLIAVTLILVFAVKWLSSFEEYPGWWFYGRSPWERRQMASYFHPSDGGSSPWGVAAVIVLLLVLMQYQSVFLDSWFI